MKKVKGIILAGGRATRLYHLTSIGHTSRYDLAKYFIQESGLSNKVEQASIKEFNTKARWPLVSAMSKQKISDALDVSISTWKEGVSRFVKNGGFKLEQRDLNADGNNNE